MTLEQFNLAIADIEKHMEGEGYTLNLQLTNGRWLLDYAHQTIVQPNGGYVAARVLVLSKSDRPPVYLCPSAIVCLELAS